MLPRFWEYSDTNQAIRKHVSENHKIKHIFRQPVETTGRSQTYFIDEANFYELVFSSKLGTAKKFRDWVFTTVLPPIRKYGQYKLFDSRWNKMIVIGNETDLHYKVVDLIRRYYPDNILVAGLGRIRILRIRDWIHIKRDIWEDSLIYWYLIITKIIKARV